MNTYKAIPMIYEASALAFMILFGSCGIEPNKSLRTKGQKSLLTGEENKSQDISVNNTRENGLYISFDGEIKSILAANCNSCHSGQKAAMGLRTDIYFDDQTIKGHKERWDLIIEKIQDGSMPPTDPLSKQNIAVLAEWQKLGYPETKQQAEKIHKDSGSKVADVCDTVEIELTSPKLLRLSRSEYQNSIKQIFGEDIYSKVQSSLSLLPFDQVENGFDTSNTTESETHYFTYIHMAKEIAKASSLKISSGLGNTCADACMSKWLESQALKIWRRQISSEEKKEYQAITEASNINNAEKVEIILSAMLSSPNFLFKNELSDAEGLSLANGDYRLDDFELASKISFFITGTTPDDELLALAQKGELFEQLDAQIDRLLNKEASRENFLNFFEQWAKYKPSRDFENSEDTKDLFRRGLKEALIEELNDLIANTVFQNNGGVADFFTNKTARVSHSGLAKIYNVPTSASSQSINRSGFLNRAGYLAIEGVHPNAIERGAKILNTVLCSETILPDDIDVNTPEESEGGRNSTLSSRQKWEELTKPKQCASCHNRINPLGFSFGHFDTVGRKIEIESIMSDQGRIDHKIDSRVLFSIDGNDDQTINDSNQLSEVLSQSKQVHKCFINSFTLFATGKKKKEMNSCSTAQIVEKSLSGRSVKDVVKDIINNPVFLNKRF